MKCRSCGGCNVVNVINLEQSPPSNSYISSENKSKPEKYYPLELVFCSDCSLLQTIDYLLPREFFSDSYSYQSSTSKSWLRHSEEYFHKVCELYNLNGDSFVIEVASNDGYLLQYFQNAGIKCLGIEPADSVAELSQSKGIETLIEFLTSDVAEKIGSIYPKADLIVANNVLAHVPDINDFVLAISSLLKEDGVATFEFPHLLHLVEACQFDTIYHEHYSYLSIISVRSFLNRNGLIVIDIEEVPTHGGSLRLYVGKNNSTNVNRQTNAEQKILEKEIKSGLGRSKTFSSLMSRIQHIKLDLIDFLVSAKRSGKNIYAYGAAAKGNTILNYCGVKSDFIQGVFDEAQYKIGKLMPGSRIPIIDAARIREFDIDILIVLPWNLVDEIVEKYAAILSEKAQIITLIPQLKFWKK